MFQESLDVSEDVLDEIALEGLDGITTTSLFLRLQKRKGFLYKIIDEYSKKIIWNTVIKLNSVKFFVLLTEREDILTSEDVDFLAQLVHEGKLYKISPVPPNGNGDYGSCELYNQRKDVTCETRGLDLEEAEKQFGRRLVLVADQKTRIAVLYGDACSPDHRKINASYIYLELIGRSRERGLPTAGPGSAQAVTKDARTVFYHLQQLTEEGVVRKYNRTPLTLLALKRFKIKDDDRNTLIKTLLHQPNFTMEQEIIWREIPGCKDKSFVKKFLVKGKNNMKLFERVLLPYSEMYPDGPPLSKKKKVACLRLVDPEKAIDLIRKDQEENDEDAPFAEDGTGTAEDANRDISLGMSVTKQIYLAVLESRSKGVTVKDLTQKLLCSEKTVTAALMKLIGTKVVKENREQDGKQTKRRATLSETELQLPAVIERLALLARLGGQEQIELTEKSMCAEAANDSTDPLSAIAEVVSDVKAVLGEECYSESERKLLRIGLILRAIKVKRAVPKLDLVRHIQEEEKKLGYKGTMDRKSAQRIAESLASDGIIKIITLPNSMTYFAEPSFDPEILTNLDNPKGALMHLIEVEDALDEMMTSSQALYSDYLAQDGNANVKLVPLTIKTYVSPKFLRLSVLHDFLFYMVRAYDGSNSLGQQKMVETIQNSSILVDDFPTDLPPLYKDRVSSYMFIPPLESVDKTPGWCSLVHMLMYTPLCMYLKLVRIKMASPELFPYLSNPIKCNYPLIHLPPRVRAGLLCNANVGKVLVDARRLCFMGLLRFGPKGIGKQKFVYSIFVNCRASILDTTTSAAGSTQIEKGLTYETISYTFRSLSDVKAYWVNLFNICLETKLGLKITSEAREIVREHCVDRLLPYLEPVTPSDAIKLDDGILPGDKLGAGGIDSALYSFLRLNWISGKNVKAPPKKPKRSFEKPRKLRMKRKMKVLATKKSRDEADNEVIGQKPFRLRANWSTREDNILVLCRVAIDVIRKPTTKGVSCIKRTDVRAALRRHVGADSMDKSPYAVARRLALIKKSRRWLGVMKSIKQTPELQALVQNRSKRKTGSPLTPEFVAEMKALFHQLVDFMSERFLKQGLVIPVHDLPIPDSLEEFNKLYDLNPEERPFSLQNIQEDSIRAVVLSSLASAVEKTSHAAQLFEVYRQYDEGVLRTSLDRLHKQRVVTLRKRFDSKNQRADNSGAYQFSQRFKYAMNTRYHQSVYYKAYLELNRLLCCSPETSTEVNLVMSGSALFSLFSSSCVSLCVHVPEQFVQIDHRSIPPHISSKIMARYKQLQDGNAVIDPEKPLEDDEDDDDDDDGPPPAKRAFCSMDLDDEVQPLAAAAALTIEDFSMADSAPDKCKNITLPTSEEGNKAPIGVASAHVALMLLREIAKSVTEEHSKRASRRPIDVFAVSSSKVVCSCYPKLFRDYGVSNVKTVRQIIADISESHKLNANGNERIVLERLLEGCETHERTIIQRLVDILEEKKTVGVTLPELRALGSGVASALRKLEASRLVFRLGTNETRIVSCWFVVHWAIKSFKLTRLVREKMKPFEMSMADMVHPHHLVSNLNNPQVAMEHDSQLAAVTTSEIEGATPVQIIVRPWLRVDGSVNRRILDRMLGSVLGSIMTYPGGSLTKIGDKFTPALTPIWIQELVELLHKIGCITLMGAVKTEAASLFTESSFIFSELDGMETHDEILVEPKVDAIIKLGQFIGNKSYSKDILLVNEES